MKDKINTRESIEWANFWYSRANEDVESKIALLGDSTLRMIRSTLEKKVNVPVDFFGTSSALDDELFKAQFEAFFWGGSTHINTYLFNLGFMMFIHIMQMME